MIRKLTHRLHARLNAVAPVEGVCLGERRIDFAPTTTPEQRAAAQAILDAFDPVAEQAAVEAEEADDRDRQEFLRLIREKYAAMQSELTQAREQIALEIGKNRTHIKALEAAFQQVRPQWQPPQW